MNVVLTCEHAGNIVPEEFYYLFFQQREVLDSHRGWDPGAWEIASHLSSALDLPALGCFTSRLLIEANRSLDNPQLFSSFSQALSASQKAKLIQTVYQPYREKVETLIASLTAPVLQLSVHTFTPVWEGQERKVDIGLLFDPRRSGEGAFCEAFQRSLQRSFPGFSILFNEPYQGIEDGFTTFLRTRLADECYLGIEIEVNQKFVGSSRWPEILTGLAGSLADFLG